MTSGKKLQDVIYKEWIIVDRHLCSIYRNSSYCDMFLLLLLYNPLRESIEENIANLFGGDQHDNR